MDKRFIEESFPIKEISMESSYEKNIRTGHISSLHIWWARRPLASSRSTIYASLIKKPRNIEDWNQQWNFIIELGKWENTLNQKMINKAKMEILKSFKNRSPKILDPFTGGGAIPLEALRLGCETYASEYNPVAILIEKCTLEYPQMYGQKLINEVNKWANILLKDLKEEIGKFYPIRIRTFKKNFSNIKFEEIPICYLWARTIICQNPNCEKEIPLLKQFWLAKKPNKKVALFPYIKDNQLFFKIVGTGYEDIPENFNPDKGTISNAVAQCLFCGSTVDPKDVKKQLKKRKENHKMIAVVYYIKGKRGKKYRIASKKDIETFEKCKIFLQEKIKKLKIEWNIDPLPNENLPPENTLGFRIQRYGMYNWSDVFNFRQKLVLISIVEKIRNIYRILLKENYDKNFAKAIISYLALILSKSATTLNNICRWNNSSESIAGKPDQFGQLEMRWDYPEVNPFSESTGSIFNHKNSILKVNVNFLNNSNNRIIIKKASATSLPFSDNFFDAVFTDPPYYDNIPYSYLSDFFYVWLKRAIGHIHSDLFSTPTTPKSKDIVAYSHECSIDKGRYFFEDMLKKAFKEIHRVLKDNGIAIIVYAHKTTEGWESLINSLLDSGLVVTSSWPIETERKGRQRAQESAALASSIYIVARKYQKQELGLFPEIKIKLEDYLNKKLKRLWEEGISGADFFISAIGAGIEVFGKYKRIIDFEGNLIRGEKLLEEIRKIVIDFAIKRILHNGFSNKISLMSQFYILWRWNYQESKVLFDEARKLAQSMGIRLDKEWNKGFIRKGKKFIQVIGPQEREIKDLENSNNLIDVLHYCLISWERGEREKIIQKLSQTKIDKVILFRVAQAISQSLPNKSKEKKLLDGFLSGKRRIIDNIKVFKSQKKIDRWIK